MTVDKSHELRSMWLMTTVMHRKRERFELLLCRRMDWSIEVDLLADRGAHEGTVYTLALDVLCDGGWRCICARRDDVVTEQTELAERIDVERWADNSTTLASLVAQWAHEQNCARWADEVAWERGR